MAEPIIITDPNGLSDLSFQLSTLALNEPGSGPQPQLHIKLVLLQPLANPEMLSNCRTSTEWVMRTEWGFERGHHKDEFLNIQPLSAAWRQAMKTTTSITKVTFDLSLPRPDGSSDEFQEVFWDTKLSKLSCLALTTQHVMTMVVTLATAMKMRTTGDLSFDLTYCESKTTRGMLVLERQLQNLSDYKRPVQVG